jgi:hypothetical protein
VIYQFNASPRRNIGVLCNHFECQQTPANVAQLLRQTPGLLGDKIGEFLCHPDNESYLKAYFQTINLHVDFLEAMRLGLSGPFFMPGEAQQVERTMQALSEAYMEQNPAVFGHVNDPVVLGYALVMLNTDMLKPNVTRKMTIEEFVANTSGALQHSSIARENLVLMYNSLKVTPFAFAAKSNDFMALCAPKLRGWLKKRGTGFMGGWKLHYYVLANSCVYYFKDESPGSKDTPLGMIQLTEVEVQPDPKSPLRFNIIARGEQIQTVKLGGGVPKLLNGLKNISFEARSKDEATKWLYRLKKSAIMSCFLDAPAGALDLDTSDPDQEAAASEQ